MFDTVYDLKKIQNAKDYLLGFWNQKEMIAYSSYPLYPNYRKISDSEKTIELAAENILSGAELPGFNVPRYIADLGPESLPAYWGGTRHTYELDKFGIDPVIFSANDVDKVSPVTLMKGNYDRLVKGVKIKRSNVTLQQAQL
jgi:hypothetical protein